MFNSGMQNNDFETMVGGYFAVIQWSEYYSLRTRSKTKTHLV